MPRLCRPNPRRCSRNCLRLAPRRAVEEAFEGNPRAEASPKKCSNPITTASSKRSKSASSNFSLCAAWWGIRAVRSSCFVGRSPRRGQDLYSGMSIAKATGRKFVRMSLGGVRDEAEDSRPSPHLYRRAAGPGDPDDGRRPATRNPVFCWMKSTRCRPISAAYPPSAALLEVLDPEQNQSHVRRSLSRRRIRSFRSVLRPGTPRECASHHSAGPLRDRMEVIRLSGYTELEKLEIAKRFLVKKQTEAAGLNTDQIQFTDDGLSQRIQYYTRESGVRAIWNVRRWAMWRARSSGRSWAMAT